MISHKVANFAEFLHSNNCYDEFIENFRRDSFAGSNIIEMISHYEYSNDDYVNSFGWSESPQGHEYWESIRRLWLKRIGKYDYFYSPEEDW